MTHSRWTSRKFYVCMGVFALSTGLLAYGLIDQETWKWISSATVVAYMSANVVEKIRNGN